VVHTQLRQLPGERGPLPWHDLLRQVVLHIPEGRRPRSI